MCCAAGSSSRRDTQGTERCWPGTAKRYGREVIAIRPAKLSISINLCQINATVEELHNEGVVEGTRLGGGLLAPAPAVLRPRALGGGVPGAGRTGGKQEQQTR